MITYNGKPLRDYGVFVDESAAHLKAKQSYETVSIAGRNGDLTYSNNRFENIDLTFSCFIRSGFIKRFAALMQFVNSEAGYHRLEMQSEADYYREAIFVESSEPTTGAWADSGTFTLTFNCKPQRWFKSGEREFESPSALFNPSPFEARPLIRVYGAGELKVASDTLTIKSHNYPYIDIDCYMQDAFYDTANCNSLITLSSGEFPTLHTGKNGLSFTGEKYVVTPRWWTI